MSNLTTVRVFLEAKSKEEMIIKQMENNSKRGTWFDYSVPVKDGNVWVCWYFDDLMKRPR
jgi:hypothetical protein